MSSSQKITHFILTVGPGLLRLSPALEVIPARLYEVVDPVPENTGALPLGIKEAALKSFILSDHLRTVLDKS